LEADWFIEAWDSHARGIIAYCVFATGSRTDGEDIASDVFVALLETTDKKGVPPDCVEAWLYTVARNLCASHHRLVRRRVGLLSLLRAEPDFREESDVWNSEELWAAARRLDEHARLVIYLRLFEDRAFADIARVLDRKESAVKMTYYRALDRMRRFLGCKEPEDVGRAAHGGVRNAD